MRALLFLAPRASLAGAALCLLWAGQAGAFIPSPVGIRILRETPRSTPFVVSPVRTMSLAQGAARRARPAALSMLKEPEGRDAFALVSERESTLGPLHNLPKSAAKVLKVVGLPLGLVAGYALTPLKGPAIKLCGGLAGFLLARMANQRVRMVSVDIEEAT
jgi:hypothetical protein